MTEVLEVHVSVPDKQTATQISQALLSQSLAACVQTLGPIHSEYLWKGSLENASEYLLMIKTVSGLYQDLEKCIKSIHPYEIAEIIALPVRALSGDYQEWIYKELGLNPAPGHEEQSSQ